MHSLGGTESPWEKKKQKKIYLQSPMVCIQQQDTAKNNNFLTAVRYVYQFGEYENSNVPKMLFSEINDPRPDLGRISNIFILSSHDLFCFLNFI